MCIRDSNKIMGVEFADRLKKVVDEYNNRRRDEAYANEVLDDVAEMCIRDRIYIDVGDISLGKFYQVSVNFKAIG